jgi:glutamyl-tRNA synthetase
MAGLDEWTHDALKGIFESLAAQAETGLGQYIHPVRLALTGKSVGPGLFELAELLGKETCLRRMGTALEYVESLRA